jgi:branched-subunit amino acid aminotransferase/4-amino-4-deoxychorismate lyase
MSLPLADALRQCELHAQRMQSACRRIGFPLQASQLAAEDEALITLLDQFVFRYAKLQDTLGEHVLRQFCTGVLLEPVEDAVLADVLALLERKGYLTEFQWRVQRSMRNALTHEYPVKAAWQAEALNQAHGLAQQLLGWLDRLRTEFESQKLE